MTVIHPHFTPRPPVHPHRPTPCARPGNRRPAAEPTTHRGAIPRTAWPLALLLLACRTSPIYVPEVQTQLAVQPAEVRAGDTVRIVVTLTNPGPDSVVLEFGDEECPVTFTVQDETDRAVPIAHETAGCLAAEQQRLVLAPGGTWRVEDRWQASREGGAPLPPAAYHVSAVLGEHESVVRGRREYKMGSGAGRVPLRILPAQAEPGS